MPSIAELKEDLDDLVTMKFISSAFTEASAVKLKNIKVKFEQNREFYEEISHVYHLVRLNEKNVKKAQKAKETQVGRTLTVAVTSNQRFYGNLNLNIMHSFLADTASKDTDLIVVGVTGQDYLRLTRFVHPFDKITFTKDFPSSAETKNFLEKTQPYDTVLLYYPKFVTLLTQSVGIIDITQAAAPGKETQDEEINILFEPEYSQILEFFQQQVRSLLFLRVMLESDLARTAARLITMSQAEERSDELIKEKKSELRKVVTSFVNRQLLETFAGMTKWNKK